ncbi:29010_t:CDS:2, partial [Gigaspora margarita]
KHLKLNGFEQLLPEYFIMLNNKKYEHYSSLSTKIKKLLQSNGLKVRTLNSTDKFSTIEHPNLVKGEWLIVGSQLIDNNGEDKWE